MRRSRMTASQSNGAFKGSLGVHPKNRAPRPMRGGIRL